MHFAYAQVHSEASQHVQPLPLGRPSLGSFILRELRGVAKFGVDTAANEPSKIANFIPTQAIQFHIRITPPRGAPLAPARGDSPGERLRRRRERGARRGRRLAELDLTPS